MWVVEQLVDLRRKAAEIAAADGRVAEDEAFVAEQNARPVRNAERYYRAMFRGRVGSWNLRDEHMADTLDAPAGHLGRDGEPARIVVWAHNPGSQRRFVPASSAIGRNAPSSSSSSSPVW
jgi:erythromycin esterase-like protein